MKEIVVISGKGGTGKTSIVASFAALAKNHIMADCDVDAADLHLILEPEIKYSEEFSGGKMAKIEPEKCTNCGKCYELCRFDAVVFNPDNKINYKIDELSCEGCGVCVHFCGEIAIDFRKSINGRWFISETRFGPMVHAKLGIAEENSGKLVTIVREKAKEIANKKNLNLCIVDGSPGIGCPVISSITGSDLVLIVTEPTLSGIHDMQRVTQLAQHFNIPVYLCINKWDINPEMTKEIENYAKELGIEVLGKIKYDNSVTKAQIFKKSIIEYNNSELAKEVKLMWDKLKNYLEK